MIGPGFDGLDPNDPFHSYHRDPPWSEEGQMWGVITTNEAAKDWQHDYGILRIASIEAETVEARVMHVEVKPYSNHKPGLLRVDMVIEVTKRVE